MRNTEPARDEFLKDAAVEPDLALNYDELGEVYWQMQDDRRAEQSYREALRYNPRLVNSRLGLARIYQRQGNYAQALAETDTAVRIDPDRTDAHYMRGQLLLRLGRKDEANKELQAARTIGHTPARSDRAPPAVPSPELLQEPQ